MTTTQAAQTTQTTQTTPPRSWFTRWVTAPFCAFWQPHSLDLCAVVRDRAG